MGDGGHNKRELPRRFLGGEKGARKIGKEAKRRI